MMKNTKPLKAARKSVKVIRPPDIHVGGRGLTFYQGFFILLFVFFRNSTISGHMVGSKCDLKMHVRKLLYPFLYKSGAQNHLFRRFHNIMATSTAYIFVMKHDPQKQASANCKGSPTLSRNDMNFGPQTASSWK